MKKMFVMIVALLVSTIAFAQGTISGSVTDGSTGDPLPGASVLVKGTTNGVTADFDGNFTITANSGDVLVISYLGFQALEVAARNGMSIELATSSKSSCPEGTNLPTEATTDEGVKFSISRFIIRPFSPEPLT